MTTEFAEIMALKGDTYQWEAIEITTSDNYILTLHHVWNTETRVKSMGPVLFQHGNGGSSESWVKGNETIAMKLADRGHDIYLGNARGNKYSRAHVDYDPWEDEEQFWDYSFENLADDGYANVEYMFGDNGHKGWYFGTSQGTASMQVALSKYDEYMGDWLNRVILTAPCIYLNIGQGDEDSPDPDISESGAEDATWLRDIGIWVTNGENWDRDIDTICEKMPSKCNWAKNSKGDPKPTKETEHLK